MGNRPERVEYFKSIECHERDPRCRTRRHYISYFASKADVGDVEDADAVVDMGMDVSVDVVNQVRPGRLCEAASFAISEFVSVRLCWRVGSSGVWSSG